MSEPPRRRTGRIELVTGAIFIALMALVATTYAPFRDALDTARTTIGSLMPSPSWAGYYLEIEEEEGSAPSAQLIFTSGSFPGRAARVIDPPFFPGRWSPSGEQFAFTSRSRLLIADRGGGVRLVGELLDLVPAGPPIWAHEHELVLTMTRERETAAGWWFVRVDTRTGLLLDQRALAPYLRLDSLSADGRWALAWDDRRAPDPQGGTALVLYEPASGRELPPRARESFAGWAPDGRLLVKAPRGTAWVLEARDAEATSGDVLADLDGPLGPPAIVHGPFIALVEYAASGKGSIRLVKIGEPAIRVADGMSSVYYASPSRDGRYVAFTSEVIVSGIAAKPRAGLIEVATGRVTYACDAGCAGLDLR